MAPGPRLPPVCPVEKGQPFPRPIWCQEIRWLLRLPEDQPFRLYLLTDLHALANDPG